MSGLFATGADSGYGYHLLNLLGSLGANSGREFDRVLAYDLGLTAHQRGLLDAVRGVEVRTVPPFVGHWRDAFTWKPWIWTHAGDRGDRVLWVDAGATVLRPLTPVLEQIAEQGYLLVSQERPLREVLPRDWYELYGLDEALGDRDYAAAGVIGFEVGSAFFERVVEPVAADCAAGRSLGFSAGEAPRTLGRRPGQSEEQPLRDCEHFRHDQSVLNARLFAAFPDAALNDLRRYAGWQSRRDHPEQLIWHHRRPGPLTYLPRVRYERRVAWRGVTFGIRYRSRWWLKVHRNLLTPSPYLLKLRKLARAARRAPA